GLAQDAGIRDTVQTNTTGDAQALQARLFVDVASHSQKKFFRDLLNAGSDVRVVLVQLAEFEIVGRRVTEILRETCTFSEELQLGRSWITKQLDKLAVVGLVRGVMETEIIHVQREGAIPILPDHFPYFVDVSRLAVRRHAHDFVFAFIDFESQEGGEGAVKQAD